MTRVDPPDDEIWQGDLFSDVPWAFVADLDFVDPAGEGFRRCDLPLPGNKARLVTRAGRGLGILVSHECVVDKNQDWPIAFARVFPMARQPRTQEQIRSGELRSSFYLPASDGIIDEAYVDFRFITSIHPKHLAGLTRIGTLDESGRQSLKEQFIRHWMRVEANL